ncbi:hypothetical protein [Pseudomonas lini]|uniref:hypothetical protein n=1 Tax=Pseudomonas lini TaxID=163011 RepID=UPI00345E9EFE
MNATVRSAVESADTTPPIHLASIRVTALSEEEISTLKLLKRFPSCMTVHNHALIAFVILDEVHATVQGLGTTPNSFDLRQPPLSTVFQLSGILYNAS